MVSITNPIARQVYEDAHGGRGSKLAVFQWVIGLYADAHADAFFHAYADAHADADAHAHANAHADAHADAFFHAHADAFFHTYADAFFHAYADARADTDADADADTDFSKRIKEHEMRAGLYAVKIWDGYGRVGLRVGWFQREADLTSDDWQVWWVTPYRTDYTKLSEVWVNGPDSVKQWTWGPQLEAYCSRLHFAPLAKLDPSIWSKVCPKPKGWVEE